MSAVRKPATVLAFTAAVDALESIERLCSIVPHGSISAEVLQEVIDKAKVEIFAALDSEVTP